MFAKIDSIYLLTLLFEEKAVMTPRIRDEILAPLTYGYTFPLAVISTIKTMPLPLEALEEYVRLQANTTLGRGELEAIAYCKIEGCAFVTNDLSARKYAEAEKVSVISLQALLKALWKKNLKKKKEVREILERIKEADNLFVDKELEDEIFE
jgi:predicted nucleic acid-binding protein